LSKKWSGTSPRYRPTKTEYQTTVDLTFVKCLWMKFNSFAINSFDVELLNQPHGHHPHQHRAPYDTVHMKRLQPKHFLNAEPADDFRFYEDYAEQYAYNQIFQIMIPFMFQPTLVYTYCV